MRAAYHADSALEAEAALTALAAELDKTHPGAAASLREGLDQTLSVLRLGLPPTLARTFRSTNAIESIISLCRDHAHNVKRWRDGQMALRWCAAGMLAAGTQFRRVNGHLHLPKLRAEIGADMARFPSAAHLASWAGVCPGNNKTAGKAKSGHTRPGNRWLKSALAPPPWAPSVGRTPTCTPCSAPPRAAAESAGWQRLDTAIWSPSGTC